MKPVLQMKKSPIAGAKCKLVMLYYRDLYEMHEHCITHHRLNYDKELIQLKLHLGGTALSYCSFFCNEVKL